MLAKIRAEVGNGTIARRVQRLGLGVGAVADSVTHPPRDPWTVAIHATQTDVEPLGVGVVIDAMRVLTCARVVRHNGQWRGEVWVAFPKADGVPWDARRLVRSYSRDGFDRHVDLTVLELVDAVPTPVTPARLRLLPAAALHDRRWWAFGFPGGAESGSAAHGTVGTALSYGQMRLENASRQPVERGFSGGPVWAPEYEAVVGLVVSAAKGDAHGGDGTALTLHHANAQIPDLKLDVLASWTPEAAGAGALAAWGWTLHDDPERGRHWLPRARGVNVEGERGYRFRGRTEALLKIVQWLARTVSDGQLLVVTGSPGVGKSAVLGRIVTTADKAIHDSLPDDDDAVRAHVGQVSCAVHVRGKSALEVAVEIARGAGVGLPAKPEHLVPALRSRLADRPTRFNLIVDALDEAASPAEARLLVRKVLLPLAKDCADVGVAVVVGTRHADNEGDLLAVLNGGAAVIDLDDEAYFAEEDLAAYAQASLQLVGAERPGNPYADAAVAEPVARRIASLARRNFLVAGLVARTRGLSDAVAIDPDAVAFTATVDAALKDSMAGLAPAGEAAAQLALTVLAYAQAPGLPLPLWQTGVVALGGRATEEQLAAFARTSAANFLVETTTDSGAPAYRLFHQALNEALLRRRDNLGSRVDDERGFVDIWVQFGQTTGWSVAPEYLLRWLPAHAGRCGRIDELLTDDGYLLHADLRRLIPIADAATTELGRARARLLQLTPNAVDAPPPERAAMFSVTQTLDGLASRFAPQPAAPYLGSWAQTPPRLERTVLEGHSDGVLGVCAVLLGGRSLLASASEDGTVRLWDPATGQAEQVLEGHDDRVRAVCGVPMDDEILLASGSEDGTVRLWDPAAGTERLVLNGHSDWVRGVCAVRVGGVTLVASVSDDRTLRLWDPETGRLERMLPGHIGWVTALCVLATGERTLLASAGYDGEVRIWDPVTGGLERALTGHTSWVTALCAVSVGGRTLLASAGYDGSVLVWDPATGDARSGPPATGRPVTGVCAVPVGEREVLAWTSEDGRVRVWDPGSAEAERILSGHTERATAVCAVPVGGRYLLASTSEDGTVRLWDPATGEPEGVLDGGRTGPVTGLCPVRVGGVDAVASTNEDGTVRLCDARTGAALRTLSRHHDQVTGVCTIPVDGQPLLASTGHDRMVRLWDVVTGDTIKVLDGHTDWATGICAVPLGSRHLLASAGDDHTVRLWNPANGEPERVLDGHADRVTGVCVVPSGGRHLVASASHDCTVRLWDPGSGGTLEWTLSGHHAAVTGVCAVPVGARHLLASASADRTVRLWDPDLGRPGPVLHGHRAAVTAVCAIPAGEGYLLASAGADRTVRIWDPASGALRQVIPVYYAALSCHYISGRLVIGLDNGMLALTLAC
jgi:WD40 repeat protein